MLELPIADEAPYAPGARRRPKGALAASNDDELIAKWNLGGPDAEASQNGKPAHPAPRIKVDVVQIRGHLEEAEVLRLARSKGYWPFRLCYEEGLRRTQKLHGKIRLRVTVGPNGAPRSVGRVEAELDDAAVVSCVVKAAKTLAFATPERGTPEVTLEVSLWPGDASIQKPAVVPRAGPVVSEALVAALRALWPEVRACYADGVARKLGLWGRLALRLRITASGQVTEAAETESRFPDREVVECATKVYVRAELPPSNEELDIVYPLRLGGLP